LIDFSWFKLNIIKRNSMKKQDWWEIFFDKDMCEILFGGTDEMMKRRRENFNINSNTYWKEEKSWSSILE